MIGELKPYGEYQPSGSPWLGPVPAHWQVRKLRHACEMRVSNVDKHTNPGETPVRLCNYVDVYKNERIRESIPFMTATATEDERIRFGLRKGDVRKEDRALAGLLEDVPALPFEDRAAAAYAAVRTAGRERRRDVLDRLIAGHAIAADCVLVTNADFPDYPGLQLESWVSGVGT